MTGILGNVTAEAVCRICRITEPIGALSKKVQQFGEGHLVAEPVSTNITELQTLDSGFDEMARRVDALMEKQIQNQQSLHRAELELLQAQINPHFLYNTLDSIAILAECQREEDVVNMVTSLSTFFRNSLNKGEDIISLAAERTQVTSYLEIQQIRYSDILRYRIDIPDQLLDCRVPKLILQPLVENALYHGIKNRRGMGKITITGGTIDSTGHGVYATGVSPRSAQAARMTPRAWATWMPVVMLLLKNSSSTATISGFTVSSRVRISREISSSRRDISMPAGVVMAP